MKDMLVSVIIPTYNRMETIRNAVNSVLQQSHGNIEVIVVDDASVDQTEEMILSIDDKRLHYVKNCEQKGANYSRNVGIEQSHGEIIAFCDSADTWAQDKLEKQLKRMYETGDEIVFCGEEVKEMNSSHTIPFSTQKAMIAQNRLSELLAAENCIDTSTLLIRKACFNEIGYFDLELPRLQEYEWMIRAVQRFQIGYLDEVLVYAVIRKDSISSDLTKLLKAVPIIYRKHSKFFALYGKQMEFLLSPIKLLSRKNSLYEEYEKYFRFLYENIGEINEYKKLYTETIRFFIEKDFISRLIALNKQKGRTLTQLLKNKSDDFYIFGAGEAARKLCECLEKQYITNLVKAFIVTNKKNNVQNILDVPMLELRECDEQIKSMPVILAVSESILYEIISELRKCEFSNIICLTEEERILIEEGRMIGGK